MSVTFIVDLVSGTFVQLSVKHYLIHSRWIVVYCSLVLPGPEPARGTEGWGVRRVTKNSHERSKFQGGHYFCCFGVINPQFPSFTLGCT